MQSHVLTHQATFPWTIKFGENARGFLGVT